MRPRGNAVCSFALCSFGRLIASLKRTCKAWSPTRVAQDRQESVKILIVATIKDCSHSTKSATLLPEAKTSKAWTSEDWKSTVMHLIRCNMKVELENACPSMAIVITKMAGHRDIFFPELHRTYLLHVWKLDVCDYYLRHLALRLQSFQPHIILKNGYSVACSNLYSSVWSSCTIMFSF